MRNITNKPDDSTLRIEAVADPRMRGGAGEAVHIMNLLFGLHEKQVWLLKPRFLESPEVN